MASLDQLRIDRSEQQPAAQRNRTALYLSLVACATLALAVLFWRRVGARMTAPELDLTSVISAGSSDRSGTLSAQGYVVPRHRSRVSPRRGGRVDRLHVSRGSRVKIGDLLLELESETANAELHVADQELNAARARAHTATATVLALDAERAGLSQKAERQHWLFAQGAAPRAESADIDAELVTLMRRIDVARAQSSSQESEMQVARARVETQRLGVKSLELRAPVAGVVMNDPPSAGEYLNPEATGETGRGYVEIADTSELLIEVEVNEAHLRQVRVLASAEVVLDADPGATLKGSVFELAPSVDRARATAAVRIKLLEPVEQLLPDMAARVQIALPTAEAEQSPRPFGLLIPAIALTHRAGAEIVFVAEGDRVRARTVRVGPATKAGLPLLDGPAAGTLLVANPPPSLSDGQLFSERKTQ